jgi:selenocysteine-specific elongation factor
MTTTIAEAKQVIIGTAGHIDHGKTALVKALTGIDADTLAEEKRRGITIELGFVFMDEPGLDRQIVFIDVPGHEKLVKTMVAGASNIDAALLVIAADDGISAQTVEHFDILQLLGIETGVIALTKTDLVDEERIQQVTEEIRGFVAGTFMREAPIVPVSSLTGFGVDEIRSALLSVARDAKERQDSGIFRMPIDRVFTMHGFGVVIAGTILSGAVRIGDKVEILPDGLMAKVRGIQIHNQSTQESHIGRRTAINLQDVKKEQLRRGQCAGTPGSLSPTTRLDARLRLLKRAAREMKNRSRLRIHIATDEVICRVVLLDREKLLPGEAAPVQFVLESPTVALPKDRFIVRTFSPLLTIGGGQILDATPLRHKRSDPQVLDGLMKLEGDLKASVEQVLLKAGSNPQRPMDVALSLGAREDEVTNAITELHDAGRLVKIATGPSARATGAASQGRYLHARSYSELGDKLTTYIKDYLQRNPYRLLMPLADLQSRFLKIGERQTFESIVDDLFSKGKAYRREAKIGLVGYEIELKSDEQRLADQLEREFKDAGFAPPLEEDVRKSIGAPPSVFGNLMTCLIERERLVRLNEKVTYHEDSLSGVREIVAEHLRSNRSITVGELRDKLGVSRKYALALLEHFDTIGFTKREGDKHVLR